MNCDFCKKEINVEFGYIEIDITDWHDESEGSSNKIVYHKNCNTNLTESLMGIE